MAKDWMLRFMAEPLVTQLCIIWFRIRCQLPRDAG